MHVDVKYLLDFALQMQQPSVERNILGRVNVFIVSDIPKITKHLYVRMYVCFISLFKK